MFGEEEADEDEEAVETGSRPSSCGVLAFHRGTEQAMLLHVQRSLKRQRETSPDSQLAVLRSIDDFCHRRHWMMHMGEGELPRRLISPYLPT